MAGRWTGIEQGVEARGTDLGSSGQSTPHGSTSHFGVLFPDSQHKHKTCKHSLSPLHKIDCL